MMQIAGLLAGYGVDPVVTERVDGLEIWFAPVRNPDGHRYVFGDNPSAIDWRKTLRDNNDAANAVPAGAYTDVVLRDLDDPIGGDAPSATPTPRPSC